MLLYLLLILTPASHATGLPPMDTITPVSADCEPSDQVDEQLFLTYDRIRGTCAPPGPDGVDPCSRWVEESLSARRLVVWREGCTEPFQGHFVRDGHCGEVPRWRWQGRLDSGNRHTIGNDGRGPRAQVTVPGTPSDASCPAESPRTHAIETAVVATSVDSPRWMAFPVEDYEVVEVGDDLARLRWVPGPGLQHWVYGDPDAKLESAPMPVEEARRWLDGSLREPTGLALRHRTLEHREHFVGWELRGVPYCERILEMDLEQRFRDAEGSEELGPPLVGTVTLQEPAAAERCYPEG